MTRDTSVEAWRSVQESGLVGLMQRQVYNLIYEHGPLTGTELREEGDKKHGSSFRDSADKRLSELERLGVVKIAEKRRCRVTGHNAYAWEVTKDTPRKPVEASAKVKPGKRVVVLCDVCSTWGEAHSFYCGCMFSKRIEAVIVGPTRQGNA